MEPCDKVVGLIQNIECAHELLSILGPCQVTPKSQLYTAKLLGLIESLNSNSGLKMTYESFISHLKVTYK